MSISPSTPRIDTIESEANHSFLRPTQNYLINGAFDFWQRGTSLTLAGTGGAGYIADRFCHAQGGSSANFTYSRSTDVPSGDYTYSLQGLQNSVSINNSGWAAQRIESEIMKPLVGKRVTASYWVKNDNGAATIRSFYPNAIDSYTSPTALADVQFDDYGVAIPANTWTFVTRTFEVPPEGARGISIAVYITGGGTGNIGKITGLKLELGEVATPFSRARGIIAGEELITCQRYLWYIPNDIYASFTMYDANNLYFTVTSPVAMRTTAAIINNTYGTTSSIRVSPNLATHVAGFTISVAHSNTNSILIQAAKAAHGLTFAHLILRANFGFSSEL